MQPLDQEQNYVFTFKDTQIISYSNYRALLNVVMMSFRKYCRDYFRLIEEGGGGGGWGVGGDRPVLQILKKQLFFESLVFLYSGLT